jgi:hypothetical protein
MTMNCASAMTASAAQRRGWTAGCMELFSFGPEADPCGLRACEGRRQVRRSAWRPVEGARRRARSRIDRSRPRLRGRPIGGS